MTGTNYTYRWSSCECGREIRQSVGRGRPRKRCLECEARQQSEAAERKAKRAQGINCRHCGVLIENPTPQQKYCSKRCMWTAKERAKGRKQHIPISVSTCKGCLKVFRPRARAHTSYCSRECAFGHKAAAPYCVIHFSYCQGCAAPFSSKRKKSYCSGRCWSKAKYVSVVPDSKSCAWCREQFKPAVTGGSPSDYCGSECRGQAQKAYRRIEKAKRKAVIVAATIERVDPFKVFDRDGWRCQLCGIETPKAKRGSYENDAPELDHIIPLSKGGEHSYKNTQCACRRCNGLKGDRGLGQMLLLG